MPQSAKLAAKLLLPALAACWLSGCATPVGPVEVTRFHLPDTAMLGRGTIVIEPAPGEDGASIEFRTFAAAVARELTRLGYREAVPGGPPPGQIAVIGLERETLSPQGRRNPVSVGVGGGTGGYGSGVGVGLGIDLSGPPPSQVSTRLSVALRDRASNGNVWEGRASFTVRANAPLAQTPLGAAKMAQALFKDFPGGSGETITVP